MRLELPADKKLIHSTTIAIRWGDMDAYGHVNNTVYFRYMESARIELLEQLGYGLPGKSSADGTPVVANVFCNFLRQLDYPGEVRVRSYVGAVGRSSFDTYHEMLRVGDDEAVHANGGATVVWADLGAQRSMPLPAALKERLGGL
jgi:acyl-CoA thioester hydrolase